VTQAIFIDIAVLIFNTLLILFTILGYITKVRTFIDEEYGTYPLGVVDGVVLTLFLMAIAFYLGSLVI